MPTISIGNKTVAVRNGKVLAVITTDDVTPLRSLMVTAGRVSDYLLWMTLPNDTSSLSPLLEEGRAALAQGDEVPLRRLADRIRVTRNYVNDTERLGRYLRHIRRVWPDIQRSLVYAAFPHIDVVPALAAFPLIESKPLGMPRELYNVLYQNFRIAELLDVPGFPVFLETTDYYLQFADPIEALRNELRNTLRRVAAWPG